MHCVATSRAEATGLRCLIPAIGVRQRGREPRAARARGHVAKQAPRRAESELKRERQPPARRPCVPRIGGSPGLCAHRRVRTAKRVRTETIGSLACQCTGAGICPVAAATSAGITREEPCRSISGDLCFPLISKPRRRRPAEQSASRRRPSAISTPARASSPVRCRVVRRTGGQTTCAVRRGRGRGGDFELGASPCLCDSHELRAVTSHGAGT
jgi:hypothetical protein